MIEAGPVVRCLFFSLHPTLHSGKHSTVAAESEERQTMKILRRIQIMMQYLIDPQGNVLLPLASPPEEGRSEGSVTEKSSAQGYFSRADVA